MRSINAQLSVVLVAHCRPSATRRYILRSVAEDGVKFNSLAKVA